MAPTLLISYENNLNIRRRYLKNIKYLRHKTGDLKMVQNKLINISSSNVEPLTSDEDVVVNSDPTQQRRDILGIQSEIVNNFKLFFCEMLDEGFNSSRLLSQNHHCSSDVKGLNTYQTESLIFNLRYQYHPFAIAMCQNTEEVKQVYMKAIKFKLPVRVRAGGHDHAGECSGDNTILIDVTGIKDFDYDDITKVATIGAGYRFYQLTPKLAAHDRMIAHGTCATVGITGFIQGGGWSPWTRKHGMCCENLVGATVILGDGTEIQVSETENSEILWALRGGGGMSYGLVTQLKIKTFELPAEIHRFQIEWNIPDNTKKLFDCPMPTKQYPTIDVLKTWENVIKSCDSTCLLGTNLKINALYFDDKDDFYKQDIRSFYHHSIMYGYWEGTKDKLIDFIKHNFKDVGGYNQYVDIGPARGSHFSNPDHKYDHALMGDWGRSSLADVSRYSGNIPGQTALLKGLPFTPDYDAPAPHKITSTLVSEDGLTCHAGYKQLLKTLTSNLLSPRNAHLGLFSYVTLGAIVGDFYQQHPTGKSSLGVAFPYQSSQYTIQHQTWWNEDIKNKVELQNNDVFVDTNRALDWIDTARESEIEGSYGAFISFKDPAIPTEVYFQHNYAKLMDIKKHFIRDHYNHLRTRKTII